MHDPSRPDLMANDVPTSTARAETPPTAHRPPDLDVGQTIDDFDLLARLGTGGFARVYLARQRSMQRLVALKISANQGAEPQTLAQLDHPHIVRVFDQRVLPERGLRLLYMAYLAGGTLREVIQKVRDTPAAERSGRTLLTAVDEALLARGEQPPADSVTRANLAAMNWPDTVAWIGAKLAEALDYAHRRGIQHRDVKPANVLLGADAVPLLADFNVSTNAQSVVGTSLGGSLSYMSPEQLEAFNPAHDRTPDSLDARTDVYSLGVTLWELLTGRRPFALEEADLGIPTITSMVARRVERMDAELDPAYVPAGLFEVIQKSLRSDLDQRYASAEEMARQLDLCRHPHSRDLLLPTPGWRTWVARHPIPTLYAIGLGVNGFAAWFSIEYNKTALIDPLPETQDAFKTLQFIINGTFFPLCMALFFALIWPVVRGLKRTGAHSAAELTELRRNCLRLGPATVQVCLWAWVAAGVLFPVALHFMVRELPPAFFVHFLASQTLCGLIAVSYPQFAVSFVSLRAFYPRFVPGAGVPATDLPLLRRLDRVQNVYLALAVSIPMLAVALLVSIGTERSGVLGLVSAFGLVGFFVARWFTAAIHADCMALEELMNPRTGLTA